MGRVGGGVEVAEAEQVVAEGGLIATSNFVMAVAWVTNREWATVGTHQGGQILVGVLRPSLQQARRPFQARCRRAPPVCFRTSRHLGSRIPYGALTEVEAATPSGRVVTKAPA